MARVYFAAVCVALFLLCLPAVSWEQPASNTAKFPRFTLALGKMDSDGFPESGAKLCVLGRPDICYQMPSHQNYDFGLDPRSERLLLPTGGSWVFFAATFSAGGSGSLQRLAVLRYEGNAQSGKIVNLLPYVTATEISERAMWHVPDVSPYPVLVDANFLWAGGESHFEAHRYVIDIWRYSAGQDRYIRILSYHTQKKYGGEDNASPGVLAAERREILRRLKES